MTAICNTFNPTSARARRHEAHSLRRGIGFALAAVSIVLAATLLETRGGVHTGDGWAGIDSRRLPGGWEDGVPLDMLPLGVLPPDTSR